MDKAEFIKICDSKLRAVRAEYSLSQEKMACALGISKKTLVQIEKERSSLGWTGSVALCFIFGGSETVTGAFGGNVGELVAALAFEGYTETGGIWWRTVEKNERYCLQQHIVSQHYRLIDASGSRVAASLSLEDLMDTFNKS